MGKVKIYAFLYFNPPRHSTGKWDYFKPDTVFIMGISLGAFLGIFLFKLSKYFSYAVTNSISAIAAIIFVLTSAEDSKLVGHMGKTKKFFGSYSLGSIINTMYMQLISIDNSSCSTIKCSKTVDCTQENPIILFRISLIILLIFVILLLVYTLFINQHINEEQP